MAHNHWGEWERWVQMFLMQYPEAEHPAMVQWLEPPGGGEETPWFSPEAAQQFVRWLWRKPKEEMREAGQLVPLAVMPIRDGWQVAVRWLTVPEPHVDLRLQYWDIQALQWVRTEHGFRLTPRQWAQLQEMLAFAQEQLRALGVFPPAGAVASVKLWRNCAISER